MATDQEIDSDAFKIVWTRVDAQGRVVIPVEIRTAMGIEPGKRVAFIIEDGNLGLMTHRQGLKRAGQGLREKLGLDPSRSIVDEFIADRRAEAERE